MSSPALDSRDKIESEASLVLFLVPSSDSDEDLTSRPTDYCFPVPGGVASLLGTFTLAPFPGRLRGSNRVQQPVVAKPDSLAALHGGLRDVSRSLMHA